MKMMLMMIDDDDYKFFLKKPPQTNGEEIWGWGGGGGENKEGFWEEILTSWIFSDLQFFLKIASYLSEVESSVEAFS